MEQVTNLQTPVSAKTRDWLTGYKETNGLNTVGAAIAALIDEFEELKAHAGEGERRKAAKVVKR